MTLRSLFLNNITFLGRILYYLGFFSITAVKSKTHLAMNLQDKIENTQEYLYHVSWQKWNPLVWILQCIIILAYIALTFVCGIIILFDSGFRNAMTFYAESVPGARNIFASEFKLITANFK